MLSELKLAYRNIPGWRTDRKIIVIESDDWGSVRIAGKKAYDALMKKGINVTKSSFTKYDGLESNEDIEFLFDVLRKFQDISGRHPVITPACLVANPDFYKIKKSGFLEYYYEPFPKTCERYPNHNQVADLWLEGAKNRLFVPVFHGREHLNAPRWLRALQNNNAGLIAAFNENSFGVTKDENNRDIPMHLNAFDVEYEEDKPKLEEAVISGINLFKEILGYTPQYFVPPNSPGYPGLNKVLKNHGIDFINSGRIQKEPLGNGAYKKSFRWLGKSNQYGQTYIIRNCFFEPAITENNIVDPVSKCIKEITSAFFWKKPAIISTHRVNYISLMSSKNREKGLKALDYLLKNIVKTWPNAEFLTSVELGDLMRFSDSSAF